MIGRAGLQVVSNTRSAAGECGRSSGPHIVVVNGRFVVDSSSKGGPHA